MLRQAIRPPTHEIPPVDRPTSNDEIIERLRSLPIGFWSYGWENPSVRHLGPMAQDFWDAFGLGGSNRRIHTVDTGGVLIAAVQALLERVEQLEAEVGRLTNAEAPSPTSAEDPTS